MRACAQVFKIPLAVEADLFTVSGMLVNEFLFVFLPRHLPACLLGRELEAFNGNIFFNDLFHLVFKLRQILHGDGRRQIKIIIETGIYRGADGKFRTRIQPLYRLRQNMGGGMPVGLFPVFNFKSKNFQSAVLSNRGAQIAGFTVNTGGTG